MSHLLVYGRAHLPKRAQTQAVVRLYGALFWFADSKTRGAVDRCHPQTLRKP